MRITTKELKLKNGTKILYTKKIGDPFFSLSIGINVGKINENNNNRGISHYIEHMCFNGTKKYTKDEISNIPYKCGGDFNANTGKIMTQYTIQHLKEYAEEAIDLMTQLVFFPIFPKELMQKEKKIVIEELKQSKDDSYSIAFELFYSAFKDERLKHPTIGYEDTINSYTKNDILEYYNKYYNTNNLIISVCCDIDEYELLKLLEQYIPYREGKAVENIKFNLNTSFYIENFKSDIQQGILLYNISFDREDLVTAEVLNFIYGEGMNSRLFKKIREEKSLCYEIGSYIQSVHNLNNLCTYISFSDFNKKDEIIEEISFILLDMIENLKDEEIEISKIQAKRNILIEEENSSRLCFNKPGRYFNNEYINSIDFISEIEKVTKENIICLIKKIIKKDNKQIAFLNKND
ncbi:MAG: Protease 3 precursor [Candidatus Izimaplasma bacterium HR2]|nr:MAG: Protease 3 precursor [Candidatus Izimaplasma bacterium HR2]